MTYAYYIAAVFSSVILYGATVGQVIGWGDNQDGQSDSPPGMEFYSISAGGFHNLALSNGLAYGWGWNVDGQANPPAGIEFIAIDAGDTHSLAVRTDGSLMGWGNDAFGKADVPEGSDYIAVSAGWEHSLALRDDGTVIGWGDTAFGQSASPTGTTFIAIAAGGYHSLALREDGSILAWGNNVYGQSESPEGSDFVAIAAGGFHSLALRSDGTILAWGHNEYGQCDIPEHDVFFQIDAGSFHTVALRTDGSLDAWGVNDFGQLDVPSGNEYYAVKAGDSHSIALRPPSLACQFSVNARRGVYFLNAQFNSVISGTNTSGVYYEWDFNDDGTPDVAGMDVRQPTNHYLPGTYSVRLTVTNEVGEIAEFYREDYITVFAEGVQADFTANVRTGVAPFTVQFFDTSQNAPQYYAWDFTGDGITDSLASRPIFTYATEGTYDVTLTVSNDFRPVSGVSFDTITRAGYIHVMAPVVPDFTVASSLVVTGEPVSFVDLSLNDPMYWFWDFTNDGTIDSTEQNPTYIYTTPGYKTVQLTVSNNISHATIVKTNVVGVSDMSAPQIGTNALIFPSYGSEIMEMMPTNIVWLPTAITDTLAGHDVTIALMSVSSMEEPDSIVFVTNDIPNSAGTLEWTHPFMLPDTETYVVTFQVANHTGQTSEYTFSDNAFTIVPEPQGIVTLFACIITWVMRRRYALQ